MAETANADDMDRVIQMAWEDRTPFEAIKLQFDLDESGVIDLMRGYLKRSSFNLWRRRLAGRKTKHRQIRSEQVIRFRSSDQKTGFDP